MDSTGHVFAYMNLKGDRERFMQEEAALSMSLSVKLVGVEFSKNKYLRHELFSIKKRAMTTEKPLKISSKIFQNPLFSETSRSTIYLLLKWGYAF